MCGIGGISMKGGRKVSPGMLKRLADAMRHRGPDGEGRLEFENTGLVHRRLSIIDIDGGAQPLSDADDMVHLVANGEIYNFKKLQDQLVRDGVELKTQSDSEVALHLYKKHGMDFVQHLEGMYALAIFDQHTGDVVLARDPVGIKPLYICSIDVGVAFASEAGSLVRAGWCTSEVNEQAFPMFFNRQFVGGRQTLFKKIERILPGEVVRIHDGEVVEKKRHLLDLSPPVALSQEEASQTLDTLLHETVTSHLQSDVPYGAFLSGGIDSSAVVTTMADIDENVSTYTIGFSSASVSDERAQAYKLSNLLKTKHQTVEFTEQDFWKFLPVMCIAMDDLVADYASLPTLKLAQKAAEDVKVILSGEGGDEVFAGYGRYRRGGWLDKIRGRRFHGRGDTAGYSQIFRNTDVPNWRGSERQETYDDTELSRLQRYQASDMTDWLPDDLLNKVDRCLMAFGVEGRVPFLDKHMVSFGFSLPDGLKIRKRVGKYLLKSWLGKKHPEANVWEKKRGFTVPVQVWLENKRPEILNYLHTHPGIRQVCVRKELRAWLEQPLDARGGKLLFTLLCYAIWHEVYIQGQMPAHPLFKAHAEEPPLKLDS